MSGEIYRINPYYGYNYGYYYPINSRGHFRQCPFPVTIQPYPGRIIVAPGPPTGPIGSHQGHIFVPLGTPKPPGYIIKSPIERKYLELIRKGFVGTPIIPESRTPDRVGLYRHYRNGGGEWSIYWHPLTGANVVYGAIRDKWAELGCEKSFLGYPLSDEQYYTADGGRIQSFEHGQIIWTHKTGAFVVKYGATGPGIE